MGVSYLHTHPGYYGQPGNINHSGVDKIVAEVSRKPFYVVTSADYRAYRPQYDGDVEEILKNIGPEVVDDAVGWIKYYWNQIRK